MPEDARREIVAELYGVSPDDVTGEQLAEADEMIELAILPMALDLYQSIDTSGLRRFLEAARENDAAATLAGLGRDIKPASPMTDGQLWDFLEVIVGMGRAGMLDGENMAKPMLLEAADRYSRDELAMALNISKADLTRDLIEARRKPRRKRR